MRLMTWPAEGGTVREIRAEFSPPAGPGESYWLDLDLRVDPVREVLEKVLGTGTTSAVEPWEPHPRAKAVEEQDRLYALLHEAAYDEEGEVRTANCHFYLGENYLLTVHEAAPKGLEMIWQDEKGAGRRGLDHLFVVIADAMVDRYFPVLDAITDAGEAMEERIFPYPREARVQAEIFDLRKDLLNLRRFVGPMRETFAVLTRRENAVFDREELLRLAEVYDHLIRLYELIDAQRELVGGLMEMYLTGLSNHMNEIMKTLTIIATIMMPLSVIVGYYGMNFRHMPEFGWRFGPMMVFTAMLIVSGGMLLYFKRRKWF